MQTEIWKILVALMLLSVTQACAPLLVGAGGAVVADEAVENDRGGDGLF